LAAYRPVKCLLRERLKEAGITQAELSKRLNMPRTQVSDWVNNRKTMSLETAKNISELLEISMDTLYEWEEVKTSDRKRRRERE
jgi:transcriptional regulator with XRE-family HTH domain